MELDQWSFAALTDVLLQEAPRPTGASLASSLHWMGARKYEELLVWQLADQLRNHVHQCTEAAGFHRQLWLQSQLRRAAQSACSNVEGFGRYKPRDFARFLRTARGSLQETKTHLDEVRLLGLAAEAELNEIRCLADRGIAAATKLIRYLETADAP